MKFFIFFALLLSSLLAVEPPKNYPANRYYSLWKNSPVTDEPLPDIVEKENDLKDWVLVGLEEYTTGKVVTIVNRKDPKMRLRIPGPSEAAKEFSLLEVRKGQGGFMETAVVLQKGPHRGEVAFDSKYLVLRKAPPPRTSTKNPTTNTRTIVSKQVANAKGLPGGVQNTSKATPTKQPRTRYIPKPKK